MGKNSRSKSGTSTKTVEANSNITKADDAAISKAMDTPATPPVIPAEGEVKTPTIPPAEGEVKAPETGVVVHKKLTIGFTEKIRSVEFNGVLSETEQDKEQAIKKYVLNKLLRQFNVVEVEKVMVSGGKLYFNNNRTALKLPAVKEKPNGEWAETLQQYTERVLPEINKWLARSVQTSSITMEILGSLC
jgi:hypothetical protein